MHGRERQDQPDRQLPAAEHDPGRDQVAVREHRARRHVQAHQGQANGYAIIASCLVIYLT